jgi:hypothetical protein
METPEGMADRLRRRTAGAPVETVFLWASIAGMPEDLVARNVRTICTRLAPLLRGHPEAPAVPPPAGGDRKIVTGRASTG